MTVLYPGAKRLRDALVVSVAAFCTHLGMAQELAEQHSRTLRPGGAGMDAGTSAFREFQTADRPVRWWLERRCRRDCRFRRKRSGRCMRCAQKLRVCALMPVTLINHSHA